MRCASKVAVHLTAFGLLLSCALGASEWSTFRGDAQRSSIANESLAVPLAPSWTYKPAQPPAPAWPDPMIINSAVMHTPLLQTLTFDRAFHVVADAGAVYFGSSADDSVCSLDAATGALRWRYVTEGPVRLAPVLYKGKLFLGSDDGHLYALDANSGKLLWKYRAGPRDQRLPGNGRVISLWPVRSGPIVDAGQVLFTAGLFPDHGVFLCALDAESGKEVFKRPLDFTAQGMMLASADRLFVPTGRTAFWSCDRKDGKPLIRYGNSDPWKKNLVGGCFALVADGVLATGPSEDGQVHWFKFASKTPIFRANGDCVIVREAVVYLLGKGKLSAIDRTAYLNDQKDRKEPAPLWSVDAGKAGTMILAGDKIAAAGQNEIAVHSIKDGKSLWMGKLDGKAEGLALSNGRLFASLDNGQTVCFQAPANGVTARTVAEPVTDQPYPANPLLAQAAEAAIKNAGVLKGYCLVLQAGTGQLAWEIAKRSEFRVICHEEDAARVEALRAALAKTGLYGHRIEVHQGGAKTLPFPKYFANLIVSEGALTEGVALPPVDQVLRVLRPCGGVVDIAARAGTEARKQLGASGTTLPEWRVLEGDVAHGTARRGKLPGSGEWTHFYANPSNTACSGDEIRPVPMTLQWFGRPGPADMVDRHKKGPAPLYVNGRLFISGNNYFAGVDAYNGFVLWERKIPDSIRVGAFKDSSNIAATETQLLVAAGDSCLVLDAQTGETTRKIPAVGSQAQKAWGYLATVDGLIIGSVAKPGGSMRVMGEPEDKIIWRNEQPVVCSTSLFAVEGTSGKRIWEYPAQTGAIPNPSFAIGNGRIYFIQSKNAKTLESPDGRNNIPSLVGQGAQLVALDLKTGAPLWTKDVDLTSLKHILYMSYANETLVITGTRYAKVDAAETKGRTKPTQLERVRYDLFAFDAKSGEQKWKTTATPNYDEILDGGHGEQVQHPSIVGDVLYGPDFAFHVTTGKPYDGWKWKKSNKCATLSTSRYCAFSRFTTAKLPYIFDLQSGKQTPLSIATRPGCWINTLPVGGLILIPEASAGCTCEYAIQTSMALVPEE